MKAEGCRGKPPVLSCFILQPSSVLLYPSVFPVFSGRWRCSEVGQDGESGSVGTIR